MSGEGASWRLIAAMAAMAVVVAVVWHRDEERDVALPHTFFTETEDYKFAVMLRRMGWNETKEESEAALVVSLHDRAKRCERHRDGVTMFNHVCGSDAMTDKGALRDHLYAYSHANASDEYAYERIHPETYALYDDEQCAAAFAAVEPNVPWIMKPTDGARGEGIVVLNDLRGLRAVAYNETSGRCHEHIDALRDGKRVVVQRYIAHPFLIDGYKVETRCYWAVLSVTPLVVVWSEGTVRRNSEPYDEKNFNDRLVHVTNVRQQRQHPRFAEIEDSLKMPYARLLSELDSTLGAGTGARLTHFMRGAIVRVVNATRHRWERRVGTFELFGADFLLDRDGVPRLTEVQLNAGLSWHETTKRMLIPRVIEWTLRHAVDVRDRVVRGEPLREWKIESAESPWRVLVNEAAGEWYA